MIIFIFLVFGIIIGSFLNVVIYRLASCEGGIVFGSSHCRDCNHELAWNDNIPIFSYITLLGKCRYCKEKISIQYPLIEIFTGILFLVVAISKINENFSTQNIIVAGMISVVFAAMLVVLVYDLKYMEVPMIAVYLSIVIAAVAIYMQVSYDFTEFAFHIIASVASFLFFFSFSFFSDEKWMGYGDGYIASVVGLVLGPFWAFTALLLAVWSGSIVGVIIMIFKGKDMKTAIPFGPYLIGGLYLSFYIMNFFPNLLDFMKL